MEDWKGKVQTYKKERIDDSFETRLTNCTKCGNIDLLITDTLNIRTCTDCRIDYEQKDTKDNRI